MQQNQAISSGTHHSDTGWKTRSCAKLARAGASGLHETVGGSSVDKRDGGNWAVVVAKVLWLQEEGIFRTIAGRLSAQEIDNMGRWDHLGPRGLDDRAESARYVLVCMCSGHHPSG